MSFSTAATLAADFAWNGRVQLIALDAAVDIANEATNAPDHVVREKLALALIRGEHSNIFPRLVLTNETVRAADPAAITDSDLQFTVASLFTAVAKSIYGA